MSKRFKFIHAADIHLGSLLHVSDKNNANLNEIFSNATYHAFRRICDIAIEQEVSFVLLSGDIYDKEARSVRGNSFFKEQCKRLQDKEIKVLGIGGNHDPIKEKSELFDLPDNVFIFSSDKTEIHEVSDNQGTLYARIIGQSYRTSSESRKMYEQYNVIKDEGFNIALLHTQLDNHNNNYVPCSVSDLKNKNNIDYWALGHIHKCSIINEVNPTIVYPGIPQGRDFGEEGLGGILVVEVEGKKINTIIYAATSEVIWSKETVNLEKELDMQPKNISDLESLFVKKGEEILNGVNAIPEGFELLDNSDHDLIKGYVVKWTINGRGEIYSMLKDREEEVQEYLIERLNNRFAQLDTFLFTSSIVFNIGRPIKDLEIIVEKNSALREVSDLSNRCLVDENIKQELMKSLGSLWSRADSEEDMDMRKLLLDDAVFQELIKKAEQLAIDAILQRSDEV